LLCSICYSTVHPLPTLFFFNLPPPPQPHPLSLPDALPISSATLQNTLRAVLSADQIRPASPADSICGVQPQFLIEPATEQKLRRSEEHTSELQSRGHLVCRLLLEKKKKKQCKGGDTTPLCSTPPMSHSPKPWPALGTTRATSSCTGKPAKTGRWHPTLVCYVFPTR